MPVSTGKSLISSVSASMPPAEAPIAAIRKLSLPFAPLAARVSAIVRRFFRVGDFDFIVSPTAPSPMATKSRMVSRAGLVARVGTCPRLQDRDPLIRSLILAHCLLPSDLFLLSPQDFTSSVYEW